MLGDGVGGVGGDADNSHAEGPGGLEIHMVEPGGARSAMRRVPLGGEKSSRVGLPSWAVINESADTARRTFRPRALPSAR